VSGTTYTPTVSSTGDALIGRTLDGRYRVLRRLADGGMATVYLALDERLDREVALKVMREHLVHDESFVTRFRREARSAASLSHPNVVAVYDQGRDGDVMYLVMEHVPGLTLREVMREEGPLSPRAALDVLEPVLLALGEAHANGLIHRDVKPENVIINDNGTVKVADFGLARAVTSQTVTSTSGVLLGTVAYLSPEQVERGVADARSDVYAAGLMLFEMLTGTKAVDGDTAIHVAYQHVHGGIPLPSSRVPGLDPALDALVAAATARDPDDRPADASALLALLRRTRSSLSPAGLDARPSGTDAVAAAALPTATAALPVHRAGAATPSGGVATRPHTDTRALALPPNPPAPLEGVVVAGRGGPARGGNRRWWPAIVASALIAALTAWFFILGPGAMATVPSVEGRSQAEAVDAVSEANLSAQVTEAFDETVPKDQVISTDPAAGDTIQRGAEVSLVVSKGPERYEVPPVVGMTLAEATTRIGEVNLTVGDVREVFHESVPDGQVITAEPGPGASLKKGTAVEMTVSKGRKPIEVPDQTGKDATAATRALEKLGLEVDAKEQQNSDTVPKGSVISQSPRDGTLFKGDTVTLVVSKGPVLVDVPNVVGQQVDQARQALEAAGFKVTVRKALGGFFGTVRLQDPASGKAPKGSTITLTIV
jgi:beta-lactam-binding protein with PASTA domain/tRNA A-37 threonylcarbamoyl transferase component Bud32